MILFFIEIITMNIFKIIIEKNKDNIDDEINKTTEIKYL